jgi:hypothetical protein
VNVLPMRPESLGVREFLSTELVRQKSNRDMTKPFPTSFPYLTYHWPLLIRRHTTPLRISYEIPRVVEQLVHCVALQVRTLLLADFTLNGVVAILLLEIFVALSAVKLELILRRHDDVLADWAEVLCRLQKPVYLHHMSIVAAELVERFITTLNLALYFFVGAFMGFEGLLTGKSLGKRKNMESR